MVQTMLGGLVGGDQNHLAYTRADVVARHNGILFGAEHRLHQQELLAYKLRHFAGGDNGPLDDP